MDEGYIKYNCEWENKAIAISEGVFKELDKWRDKLYKLNLIGVYDNGIGFGNISQKFDDKQFIITGSATGSKDYLKPSDYALVTQWDYDGNSLSCVGNTKASSESLSHAAVYESAIHAQAVIHIHSMPLWEKYKHSLPTTSDKIAYGTPAMAYAIKELVEKENQKNSGVIVMAGHEEGILSYAPTLNKAGELILILYQSLNT